MNIVSAKRPKLSYADLVKKRNMLKRQLEDAEKELDIQRKVLPKLTYSISGKGKFQECAAVNQNRFHTKSNRDKTRPEHFGQDALEAYCPIWTTNSVRKKLKDKLGLPYKADHGYRKYDDVGRENGSCVRELFVVGIHSIDETTYDLTSKSSYVEIFDDKGVDYLNCGRGSVDDVKIWGKWMLQP